MERIGQAIDGYIGKMAIGVLLAILSTLSWMIFTKVLEHSDSLSTLKPTIDALNQNVKDLKSSVDTRFVNIDGDVGKIIDVQSQLKSELFGLETSMAQRDKDARALAPRRYQPN
jgi:hypothetical protein